MNIVESLVSKFEFTLEKYHLLEKVEKIVVAFSGGRNSTVMLDLFVTYMQNHDIQLEAYFVPFPVSIFSDSKYQEIMSFWKDKGVEINVNNDDQLFMLDKGLDVANIPCLACKNVRREKIKNLSPNIWGDGVVLATGHSLGDIVAYSVESLFINVSVLKPEVQQRYLDRLSEISGRIMPKTRTVDEVTIIRPALLIDEPEFDEYIEFKKLPVADAPCRFKMTRPKRLLFDLVRQSNYQFDYDSLLRVYASFGMIPDRSENSLESWMNLIL